MAFSGVDAEGGGRKTGFGWDGKREDTFVSYFSATLSHPSRFIRYGSWATGLSSLDEMASVHLEALTFREGWGVKEISQ